MPRLCLGLAAWVLAGATAGWAAALEPIGFPGAGELSGVVVLRDFSAEPNARGEVATLDVALPAYRRGACVRSAGWPTVGQGPEVLMFAPGRTATINEGGQAMLVELESGEWLAVLPVAGDRVFSWLKGAPDGVKLVVGHFGRAAVRGDVPVASYGRGGDPYAALRLAWRAIAADAELGRWVKLREAKTYPEMFKYLGWCSWEQYRGNVSDTRMLAAVKGIEESGLPIRYLLLDDGHFDRRSLRPDAKKFPAGYASMLAARKPDKIRWMGLWWSLYGDTHGVDAPGALDAELSRHLWTSPSNEMLPKPGDPEAATAFFRHIIGDVARGFDFFKIDFQERPLLHYAGVLNEPSGRLPHGKRPADNLRGCDNPYEAQAVLTRACQSFVAERSAAMLNCTSIATWSMFNHGDSVVTRCSNDYKVGKLDLARKHTLESYRIMPWIGDTVWGDHDMFHSNDSVAGRLMAASKAMSGGPIYLSDDPGHFEASAVRPLCYEDGLLLRPLAPAAPVADDLFFQIRDQALYRVAAPLANDCAAFAVYNLQGEPKAESPRFSTLLTPAHYANATAMMQPYPGKWDIPAEGLLCYDVYGKTAVRMGEGVKVEIAGFGDKLYQVSPIRDGWAVVGRTDKYLPAAAVEAVSSGKDSLTLRLHEAGPFALWLADGSPRAEGLAFVDRGGGLFEAEIPVGAKNAEFVVRRVGR